MCRSTGWLIVLAVVASLALCAIPALATTWSAYSDFNTASATGTPWSYGFADLGNVPSGYTLTNPGYSLTAFRGDMYSPGFSWLYNSTWKDSSGNDLAPMIGVYTGTSNYWIFTPQSVYLEPAHAHGYAPTVRWTAPSAGTYNYSGSMTDVNNSGHNAVFWIVKHSASGTYTTLVSGTLLGASTLIPTPFIGSVAMAANDSIDVLVDNDASYWMRPFVRVDFNVNSSEPPGVKGYVQNSSNVRIEGATVSDGTQSVDTAYDGTYTLVITPPGTYTISASKPGYTTASSSVVVGTSGLITQNITLPAGNTISGTVTSNTGMVPLSGTHIITSDGVYSTNTNSAGYYSMQVTPGVYTLGYSHYGFIPKTETVDATSGNVTHNVGLNIGWDVANDFNTGSNPSGAWAMGYTDSAGAYTADPNIANYYDVRTTGWCRDWPTFSASVCKNVTVLPFMLVESNSNPYIESGKVVLTAGLPETAWAFWGSWAQGHFWNNNTAVARFVSPASGPYTVTARFGAASTTADTYVPVALRYKPVGGSYTYWVGQATSPPGAGMTFVDGFQGRAGNGYTDSVGTTPVITYSSPTLNLHVGDVVEALVGFNANTVTGTDNSLDIAATKNLGRWVQTDLTVTIPASYGTIAGTVRCANQAGNPPVAGVTVTTTSSAGTFSGLTDATGFYFISLPAGSYTLTATSPAYATGTGSGTVVAGGGQVVNFNLNGNFATTVAQLKSYAVGQGVIMTAPAQLASGIVNTNPYLGTMYAFNKRYGAFDTTTDSSGTIQVATPEYAFYLQSDDRVTGIKCVYDGVAGLGSTYDPTWRVACSGVMALDSNGQKVFNVTSISGDAQPDPPAQPLPLGKTSKGLTNSNTLVKVWGKITRMQTNTLVPVEISGGIQEYTYEYIIINDGGQDVKIPMHCQYNWITTFDAGIAQLAVGDYVSVVGIAGTTTGSDVVVYPRCQADFFDYSANGRM